ncbi:MAG: hypothetical protein HDT43_05185 [Ruminococcaceae bacterium]|nr:hypothetical protein [Oscillospiraceae bacterium]
MTAPSSSKKSFFREYFLYRLKEQLRGLIICLICNLFVLPFRAPEIYSSFGRIYNNPGWLSYHSYDVGEPISAICVAVLLIMPIIGAVNAFSGCNRRKYTDMLGGLPLTNKERFWGDFLSGYTAYVAPVIPAGVFALIMSFPTQSTLDRLDMMYGYEPSFKCVLFAVGMVLSALVLLTFLYIVSTIAVVSCGRPVQSGIMSLMTLIAPALVVFGIAGCFVEAITGVRNDEELLIKAFSLFPPLGMIWEIRDGYQPLLSTDVGDPPHFSEFFSSEFSVLNPLYMLYVLVLAAALIFLAYVLFKSRRQEQTGTRVINKAYFYAMLVITTVGSVTTVLMFSTLLGFVIPAVIAVIAAALIMLLLVLLRRYARREVVKTLVYWLGALIFGLGIYILFDKTGSFGQRYFNVSSDKVESAHVSVWKTKYSDKTQCGEYEITDKAEIEKLINDYNNTCKEVYGGLTMGGQFCVDLTLEDGTVISRHISERAPDTVIHRFIDNFCRLDGFSEMQSSWITDNEFIGCEVQLDGIFGTLTIPEDKLGEFAELYAEEVREKYYHAASEVGEIVFKNDKGFIFKYWFPIAEDYTRTINYLKSLYENSDYSNDDTLILKIHRGPLLTLNIYRKDMNSASVKELLSLIKPSSYDAAESETLDISFPDSYYVPKDAEQRVFELMLEIAEKSVDTV